MIQGKVVGIDARMIEMSGIGTYIQHLMGQGIYDYAVGSEAEIRRYDQDVVVIPFDARIYGPREQACFPVKALRDAGVQMMHFPHYNVPVRYRAPFVATIHDLTHLILPEFLGNKAKYLYAKALMKQAVLRADHVFTVSQNSKRDIQSFFPIDGDKISITYNAIDADFLEKAPADYAYLYDKYAIPRDKKTILYVGNLKPHKNLGTLLEAFKGMNRDDTVLLLVGKAFESVSLDEQESQMGLTGRVIHTGLVEKRELVDFYNLADVFAFPSLYEGFGIPPLEAMACGTPVVAANNSSIPEVVGDAAILVEGTDAQHMAQAITSLLDDAELSERYRAKGLLRCHEFSWDETVRTVKECLSCLL